VLATSDLHPAVIHTDFFEDRPMDILLAEINAEAPAVFPWSTGTVLAAIARHRLSDEEPDKDDDDDDDDDEDWDDEDLDDEDWDDEDLDDDDWDDDDDDDDWDDDDDEDEPANIVTIAMSPVAARSS
jgi:hypothetical protein